MTYSLRPYQVEAVEMFLRSSDRRLILAHAMGAGKSLASLTALKELGCKRVIVVCPAMARANFVREAQGVFGEAHGILWGRARKLSKKQSEIRDQAYAAPVRVVSEELFSELTEPCDGLILDEVHNLRNPMSQHSQLTRDKLPPDLPVLGLSGTLLPNEVSQIWNPINTLWPGWYGKPTRTGDVPWKFRERFCNKVENEYSGSGFVFKGGRNLDELRTLLADKVHEVTDEQFAQYKPELFVNALHLDEPPSRLPLDKVVLQWAAAQTVTHFGVFTHLNETRAHLAYLLHPYGYKVVEVDASMTATRRDEALQAAAEMDRCVLVSTTHALEVGVDLSFLKSALVAEWTTAMDETVQFIGRFGRQSSKTMDPVYVQFLVRPDDEKRAAVLSERLSTKSALFSANTADIKAAQVFSKREYTEEEYNQMAIAALRSYRNDTWELEDGSDSAA